MGNISNSPYHRSYNPLLTPTSLIRHSQGTDFSIYKDSLGNFFEERIMSIATDNQLEQQIHIYQLRKNNNCNLVAVHSTQVSHKKSQQNGSSKDLKVMTERILFTLDQASPISTQQGLSILNQAAIGFQCLYKHVGYFEINDYLIGFNDNRQIRVWLNSNWGFNSKMENNYRQPFGDIEHIMVIRVIQVVEMHIEKSPFLGMFIERRKKCQKWTFRKLLEFIEKFIIEKKFKLTKTCHLNVDILKRKIEQKYSSSKTVLNFKVKSKSPTYQNYAEKSSTVHNSIHNGQYQRSNFSNAHSGEKHNDYQGPVNRQKMPADTFNFKNTQLLNFVNDIFATKFENKTVHFREKRMSEHIIPAENVRANLFAKHRRLSSHSIEIPADQRKKLCISARETFKLYSSKGQQKKEAGQDSSLDKIRKELRGFLGGLTEQEMRTSCPGLQPHSVQSHYLRESTTPNKEFQFKAAQPKKKKIDVVHIKTEQDERKDSSPPFSLQFGFKKQKVKPSYQLITPHFKPQPILQSTTQPTITVTLANKSSLKFKQNSTPEPTVDQTIRSTLPNHKSIQNSMLAKTASKQGQSSITTYSKTKELKQSFVIHQDTEQGNISQRNLEQRFVGFQSLKLKKPLTQSINLPTFKTEFDKKPDEDGGKKPLSLLDMMIIKRNLLKQKKNEDQLDVSLDQSLTMSIQKQQFEI